MLATWIHQQQTNHCLLFFTGWGMDEQPFAHLHAEGLDICLISRYTLEKRNAATLEHTIKELGRYERVDLLAWSLGVWVASQRLTQYLELFTQRIALAGTLWPVDEYRGLSPKKYSAMLAQFSEQALLDFYAALVDQPSELERFLAQRPQRDLSSLQAELHALRDASLDQGPGDDIFTHHLVTSRDRIFPGRNQLRAWGKERCQSYSWPHFPFFAFTSWPKLLNCLLSSPDTIVSRERGLKPIIC